MKASEIRPGDTLPGPTGYTVEAVDRKRVTDDEGNAVVAIRLTVRFTVDGGQDYRWFFPADDWPGVTV